MQGRLGQAACQYLDRIARDHPQVGQAARRRLVQHPTDARLVHFHSHIVSFGRSAGHFEQRVAHPEADLRATRRIAPECLIQVAEAIRRQIPGPAGIGRARDAAPVSCARNAARSCAPGGGASNPEARGRARRNPSSDCARFSHLGTLGRQRGTSGGQASLRNGLPTRRRRLPRRVDRKNARCRGSGILNHRTGPAKGGSAGPTRDGRASSLRTGRLRELDQ